MTDLVYREYVLKVMTFEEVKGLVGGIWDRLTALEARVKELEGVEAHSPPGTCHTVHPEHPVLCVLPIGHNGDHYGFWGWPPASGVVRQIDVGKVTPLTAEEAKEGRVTICFFEGDENGEQGVSWRLLCGKQRNGAVKVESCVTCPDCKRMLAGRKADDPPVVEAEATDGDAAFEFFKRTNS